MLSNLKYVTNYLRKLANELASIFSPINFNLLVKTNDYKRLIWLVVMDSGERKLTTDRGVNKIVSDLVTLA